MTTRHFSLAALFILLPVFKAISQSPSTTITNFNSKGGQVMKFNSMGEAIDAHDGEIAYFNGTYYLYGTSYGCGFSWGIKDAPFCGFKVYSSKDMVNWTDMGQLFDASTPIWQSRCNGNTYGCFRPHVIYNKQTNKYVLWINVYDNRVGFRVFTSKSPIGPFLEVNEPKLAVNSDSPVAGLNNGDHDTFVDDDGKGYIAYTDWRTQGTIVIEALSNDYLSGTGKHVKAVTAGSTEAPSLFKRKGIYYVTYSDPNCGYCSGTGTSYRTAKSPLGPWSEGIRISNNSCGGQPSFVSTIKLASGTIFLYGSDLWNNAAKNESLANFYWAPLSFAEDGSINPMVCQNEVVVPLDKVAKNKIVKVKDLDNTTGHDGFNQYCDINKDIQRSQSFTASRSGSLSKLSIASFKSGFPDADLQIVLFAAAADFTPTGLPLWEATIAQKDLKWSANFTTVYPSVNVVSGKNYAIVLRSKARKGCYGVAYSDVAAYKGGGAAYSSDAGASFKKEENRSLMFQTIIQKN
ncbi:family 43 glycosylhydrolase [Pedobacter sp. PWIIR3]